MTRPSPIIAAVLMAAALCTPLKAQRSRPAPAPTPMTLGLPIAEGAWVDTKSKCASAQAAWLYRGFNFGEASLNPYAGTGIEPIDYLAHGKDGFVSISGGPLEIKPLPDGRAVLRTYSLAEGEIGRTTLRRCEIAALPAALQAEIEPLRPDGRHRPVYVPGRANGAWSIVTDGTVTAAQFLGDGLIEKLAMTCTAGKDAGLGQIKLTAQLRQQQPPSVTATRLALVYHDSGTMAAMTALYFSAQDNRWFGPVGDGIVDTLDISSRIIIDLGPAGAEDIPLTGSSAAIRSALAACWRSSR